MTEKIEQTEQPNHWDIDSRTGGRIKTLDQLLRECQVNLKEWRVDHHVINKWEVGAKGPEGEIVVSPLFQVKAYLVRRVLKKVHPVVRPIKIRAPKAYLRKPGRVLTELESALILPDPQFGFRKSIKTGDLDPFHDRQALDIALQVAAREQPDHVIWLGDVLDLPDWSDKFLRSPDYYWTTQAAVVEASWWLTKFRRLLPEARMYVIEGNHDKRLDVAQQTHLIAAYQLRPADELQLPPSLSLPRLLALPQANIEYIGDYPNGKVWLNDRIVAEHGAKARANPGGTAGALVKESDVTVVHGHTHRREWATRTKYRRHGRETIEVFCPGCLCRVDGVVPGRKSQQQWQQGIAVVRYQPAGRLHYNINPIAIDDGMAIHEGSLLKARDSYSDLIKETNCDGWRWPDVSLC